MLRTITTTYDGPDLDGYGCSVAYAELLRARGEEAEAHIWGTPHIEVQWLVETFGIPPADGPAEDSDARVVLLDASDLDGLPKGLRAEQVVEIIDHRKIHEADRFPNAAVQIELIGAAATLVAERFEKSGVTPSRDAALLLYGGILSNTQNFTAVATERDVRMAAWLKEISVAPDDLPRRMFLAKSDLSGPRLRDTMFGDLKTLSLRGKTVAIAQLELIGAAELVATRLGEIQDALRAAREQNASDYTFLNAKDLDAGTSIIVCLDEETKTLLSPAPGLAWSGLVATSTQLTLRKQLSAWINDSLSA